MNFMMRMSMIRMSMITMNNNNAMMKKVEMMMLKLLTVKIGNGKDYSCVDNDEDDADDDLVSPASHQTVEYIHWIVSRSF